MRVLLVRAYYYSLLGFRRPTKGYIDRTICGATLKSGTLARPRPRVVY
jgi:hypothetical protein